MRWSVTYRKFSKWSVVPQRLGTTSLEALDIFLENIDVDQLDPFLHYINLLDSNIDINVDMEGS